MKSRIAVSVWKWVNLTCSGLPAVAERTLQRTYWLAVGLWLHCCDRASVVSYLNSCNERKREEEEGEAFFPPVGKLLSLMFNKPLDTTGNLIPSGENGVCVFACVCVCVCCASIQACPHYSLLSMWIRYTVLIGLCCNRLFIHRMVDSISPQSRPSLCWEIALFVTLISLLPCCHLKPY